MSQDNLERFSKTQLCLERVIIPTRAQYNFDGDIDEHIQKYI